MIGSSANAQTGGVDWEPGDAGSGGRNTITGSVFYPEGRRADKPIKVTLSGIGFGDQVTHTDSNGAFTFRRLKEGRYDVIVDAGKGFAVHRESVDVFDPLRRASGQQGRLITLQINLEAASAVAGATPAMVDAAFAGVPESARKLYLGALESARAGDRTGAIDLLKQALSIHPAFMLAQNELGVQYLRLGQLDKASQALEAAIKLDPEAPAPRLNYGITLCMTKDFRNAAVQLSKALEKNAGSGIANLYMGKTMIQLNNYTVGEQHLRKAIDIGGSDVVEAHRYLAAVLIESGRAQQAADELDKYLSLEPKAKDATKIREMINRLRGQITEKD